MSRREEAKRKGILDSALKTIEKQFGRGAIWTMTDAPDRGQVSVLPTGCPSLDVALGLGGLPRGRVIEIYGPEASGKTTLILELIAQVQRLGGRAACIDAEHALDLGYARKVGVQTDALLIAQPDYGEQALEIADTLVRSGGVDLVVIDSVAALVPLAELEGDMGDSHMGLQARLMSQALRKLTSSAHRTDTMVVFINQLRHKIGVTFGSPEVTTGGNALKYYASVRLDIRRISTIKSGDAAAGNRVRVRVVKNKVAPPFGQAEFDIIFGEGVDRVADVLDWSVQAGLVIKSGSWFKYQDEQLGQGREKACQWMKRNPEIYRALLVALFEASALPATEYTPHKACEPIPAAA